MYLSCQNENFQVLTCEISETTESIELKLSGIIEGINKLGSFKVSKQSDKIKYKISNKEFWVSITLGLC